MSRKPKIAVIGGGMASLSTVWHLSREPGWQDRYDITVYQLGWRLGGKGASGVNFAEHARNEEHGLHLMFGFYHNALPLLRELYAELDRPPDRPLASFDDAFKGYGEVSLLDPEGSLDDAWLFKMPTVGDGSRRGSVAELSLEILARLARINLKDEPEGLVGRVEAGAIATAIHAALELVRRGLAHPAVDDAVATGLVNTAKAAQFAVHRLLEAAAEPRRAHLLILLDLGLSIIRGMATDFEGDLERPDWFSLDDESFEQWLRRHEALPVSVTSPPVRMLKDVAFSHEVGMGAGTCLHYALQMIFNYTGSFYYRMQAGMGDTVFGPLYEVLRRRGVKFAFFHRIDRLEDDGRRITAIHGGRQVRTRGAYQPRLLHKGLEVWPTEPLYDQLVEGERLRASGEDLEDAWNAWPDAEKFCLRLGVDFDHVVLGASLGAVRTILAAQIPERPALGRMVETLRTTDVVGAQLWLTATPRQAGWTGAMPLCGAIPEPLDTWADLSQLLVREAFPSTVKLCSYNCGPLDDPEPPPPPTMGSGVAPADGDWWKTQRIRARTALGTWLQNEAGALWPGIANGAGIDLGKLWAPAGTLGQARINRQYWMTPRNPSDRYVQSAPGTVQARLLPWESGYDNLFFCGDWVRNAYSAGCLEATVITGMMCAQALIGSPTEIAGDWLDAPRPPPALGRPPPPYLYPDGSGIPSLPFLAEGVDLSAFLLRADLEVLAALCDERLNLPGSPRVYRPMMPFVLHVCADLPRIVTGNPRFWSPERDFGFWIPVVAGRMEGEDFVPEGFAFFLPYLWVDIDLAVAAGREAFGYPKSLGQLHVGEDGDPVRFAIDGRVVKAWGDAGPDAKLQLARIVEVRGPPDGGEQELGVGGGGINLLLAAMGAAMAAAGHVADWRIVEQTLGEVEPTIWLVFLKQFPEVAGRTACYQAITEAPNPIVRGPEVSLLGGDWSLHIRRYASVDLVGGLGLREEEDGAIPALLAVRAKFDFRCDPGRVVFER